MSLWLRALAALAEDFGLVPSTHNVAYNSGSRDFHASSDHCVVIGHKTGALRNKDEVGRGGPEPQDPEAAPVGLEGQLSIRLPSQSPTQPNTGPPAG